MFRTALLALLLMSSITHAQAKRKSVGKDGDMKYPPQMEGAVVETYRTAGNFELKAYIFNPPDLKPGDKRPAIVCFFGGGWTSGSPSQFHQHCRYLASRGMVAITCDYRVASRQQVKAVECVKDAQAALRWVRSNAARLGIDPDRIAASGGSAGGHLAACLGTIDDLEPQGGQNISSHPNALVLFNPAIALAPRDGEKSDNPKALNLGDRTGIDPKAISPAHHVSKSTPPTIQFFGSDDALRQGAVMFDQEMKKLGNRSELLTYDGQKHGFFNFGRSEGNKYFKDTLKAADQFLASLGYLAGPDAVDAFFAK